MAGTVVADTLRADSTSTLVLRNGVASTPPTVQDSGGTEIGTFCRAWVNFNGTGTVAIRSSFNVTSITDNGNGDYTVNFTNAMPDVNYCVSNYSASTSSNWFLGRYVSYSVSAYRFLTIDNAGSLTDTVTANIAIFR